MAIKLFGLDHTHTHTAQQHNHSFINESELIISRHEANCVFVYSCLFHRLCMCCLLSHPQLSLIPYAYLYGVVRILLEK